MIFRKNGKNWGPGRLAPSRPRKLANPEYGPATKHSVRSSACSTAGGKSSENLGAVATIPGAPGANGKEVEALLTSASSIVGPFWARAGGILPDLYFCTCPPPKPNPGCALVWNTHPNVEFLIWQCSDPVSEHWTPVNFDNSPNIPQFLGFYFAPPPRDAWRMLHCLQSITTHT